MSYQDWDSLFISFEYENNFAKVPINLCHWEWFVYEPVNELAGDETKKKELKLSLRRWCDEN